ncbi:MAG: family 20 glycosylhydrolase [Flavobacteriales bacterium]
MKTKMSLVVLWLILSSATSFAQYDIVPAPKAMSAGDGIFILTKNTVIVSNIHAQKEAIYFSEWLSKATGNSFTVSIDGVMPSENFIFLNCIQSSDDSNVKNEIDLSWLPVNTNEQNHFKKNQEEYKLNVTSKFIGITAQTPTGIFYAIQSLRQMFPANSENGTLNLPLNFSEVSISDAPQFRHRGLLLDCCRHFMSKDFIIQTIDLIAQYKMNVLHWHLTEDQGWRIQIDAYPALTEVGAWRTEADGTRYGGFYSKDDIREIVAYAEAHHITIIPEIELPGHSVAAIASYPELSCTGEKIPVENEWGVFKDIYCAGNENTFEFLEKVLTEVCELFPGRYIHVGGDEAPKFRWENCAKCQHRMHEENLQDEAELQTYFIERIAAFLETKNKSIIGWDEILEGGIPASAVVQSWRGMDGGKQAAREGHGVIMSPTSHCYFDYPLTSIDLAKVYAFEPIPDSLSVVEKAMILGGECNMWTEHAPQELVWNKIFPRLMALSEVLWTYSKERDFSEFQNRMQHQYDRLDAMHVNYGFPGQPFKLEKSMNVKGHIEIKLNALEESSLDFEMKAMQSNKILSSASNQKDVNFTIDQPSVVEVSAMWRGRLFENKMKREFYPHAGMLANIELGYTPSPYYTGGGSNALIDGALGTSSFRDGNWQAVAGNDMEIILDFGELKEVSHFHTNWFHYGNAWIFRPSKVVYFTSSDGVNWEEMGVVLANLDQAIAGEIITASDLKIEKRKVRYIKMIASNAGPCPSWHDAAGEPSWLFCDELIVE